MFVLQALLIVVLPAVALWLDKHVRPAQWLGPVVLCYGFGIVLANVGWTAHKPTLSTIQSATVVLAIPLLLFSANVVAWLKLAPKTILSFVLMIVAAVTSALITYKLLGSWLKESWQMAGMLVGMYTGGTVNTIAIGKALEVPKPFYVLVTSADIMIGGVWLLFILSIAQRFCLLFLPPFQSTEPPEEPKPDKTTEPLAALSEVLPRRQRYKELGFAVGLSIAIVAISAGGSFLVYGDVLDLPVILTLTTLGIVASFFPRVRSLSWSFEAGDYLMLMFCVAIGFEVNFAMMVKSFSTLKILLLYTGCLMFGALLIHFALAALFRIDADTTLITSSAGIFGPPFIGPIARALKNRQLIVSGLTMGIAGLAIGTYLGVAIAKWLQP